MSTSLLAQTDTAIYPEGKVPERIGFICARLTERLRVRPDAIVLVGSFARQEGSVLEQESSLRVLGDMEFLVVFPVGEERHGLQAELDGHALDISAELRNRSFECELEFRAINRRYFESLPPSIFAYELLAHARVVWGSESALNSARRFSVVDIPEWDAWRMLNNRLLEQLLAVDLLREGRRAELVQVSYYLIKFHLDLATSALIFARRYHGTYAGRARSLLDWAAEPSTDSKPGFLSQLTARVGECTRYKLQPGRVPEPLGLPLRGANEEELRERLLGVITELVPLARNVWRWEAKHLARRDEGASLTDEDLSRLVLATQGWNEKVRGWGKLLLMPKVRREPGFLSNLVRLLRQGSPRYLIYAVAKELYSHLPRVLEGSDAPDVPESLGSLLPVRFSAHRAETRTWWRLRADVLTGWKLFLRNHWA